jgi:two-component system chemotaxis response regulator CheY
MPLKRAVTGSKERPVMGIARARRTQRGQNMAYNILIVDDSLPMRAVLKKTVKASGFNVGQIYEAANGKEALQILKQEWMDLVLSDYNMPEMNGIELIEEMKKDEVFRTIPVVIVTTEGSRERIEWFMKMGVSEYIKKPFTPEEIRSKLNHIVREDEDGKGNSDEGDEELDF